MNIAPMCFPYPTLTGSLVGFASTVGSEPYASCCHVQALDPSCTTCRIVSPCASARKRYQPVCLSSIPERTAKPRSPYDAVCRPYFEYHLHALSPAVLNRNFSTPSTHTAVWPFVNASTRAGANCVRFPDVVML